MHRQFFRRLTTHPKGEPVSPEAMAAGQAGATEAEILLALSYVKTREGADRILKAEMAGLNRISILQAAARRLDDFTARRNINVHGEHGRD